MHCTVSDPKKVREIQSNWILNIILLVCQWMVSNINDVGCRFDTHHHYHQPVLVHPTPLNSFFSSWHPAAAGAGGLPRRSLHSRTRSQKSLVLWQMLPAHCHFSLLILWAMSITLVLFRICSIRIQSWNTIPESGSKNVIYNK